MKQFINQITKQYLFLYLFRNFKYYLEKKTKSPHNTRQSVQTVTMIQKTGGNMAPSRKIGHIQSRRVIQNNDNCIQIVQTLLLYQW